ncbi:E3 ubiquitin-protein ligase XB3 [Hordeum vulgare]|nr:E3 ubiquitin-protein ligase XB3 [Hordeum vulgare]
MKGCKSDSDQSGSIDQGVIPYYLEESMAARITLHCSCKDSVRPTAGSVRRDSITSAQWALESSGAGSSRFRWPENLSFLVIGLTNCDSHRERSARRGKERIMAIEARIAEEMWAAEAVDAVVQAYGEEETILARILKKW